MTWVVCPNCGTRWDWNGESNLVTCYKCRKQWKVENPKYAVAQQSVNPNKQGRTIEPVKLPETLSLDTVEGQRWLMRRVQQLRMEGANLTPTDIKILDGLKDDCVKMVGLIEREDLEKRLKALEDKNK